MVKASCVPTEYIRLDVAQQEDCDYPSQACAKPSVFCAATEANGWHVIMYDAAIQQAEDQQDIEDSLEALKEPPGVSLDDLRRELGA